MGRGVPLAEIGDFATEVNSRGSVKRSERNDRLEFYADGELASVYLGQRTAHRSKRDIFPFRTDEDPGRDQPIHAKTSQKSGTEGVILTDTCRGIEIVEAPDRPAEQGVRQECADRISRACADRYVVDKLELLSDAVVETQDRRIFVANIKTNDELLPLKIIADKTAA